MALNIVIRKNIAAASLSKVIHTRLNAHATTAPPSTTQKKIWRQKF